MTKQNKIGKRVEEIFAHGVALDQSGKLRNTIYCEGSEVYVINSDQTVLLKFRLRGSEAPFEHPVSFRANDYDSRQFYEEDGKIIFVEENASFTRTKTCSAPGDTPEDIAELFSGFPRVTDNTLKLNRDVISLLDDSLSHIEIRAENGELAIVQRNIYSGTVLELTRKESGGLGAVAQDKIVSDFGPVGLRTNDFIALFSFIDNLTLGFPSEPGVDYCYVRSNDPKMAMEGIIAACVYDELGGVEVSRKGTAAEEPTSEPEEKPSRRRRKPVEEPEEKPARRRRK